MSEINRISNTTEFNERKLFKKEDNSIGQTTSVPTPGTPVTPSVPIPSDYTTPIQKSFRVTGTPSGITTGTKQILANDTSFTIDAQSYAWSDFKSTSNQILDKDNIVAGTYKLTHKGLTLAFDVKNGAKVEDLVNALNGASFTISASVKSIAPVTVNNISLSKKTNTGTVLSVVTTSSNNGQGNDTIFRTDDNGIMLKHYSSTDKTYSEQVGFVSWADMGLADGSINGGTYTFSDNSSGINMTFDVAEATTLEELKTALNNTIFEVSYDIERKVSAKGADIKKTDLATGAKVNVSELIVKHNTPQTGDFYEKLGYTNKEDILGGIDVEVYLSNTSGNLVAKYVSGGNEIVSGMGNKYDSQFHIAQFGGASNSVEEMFIGLTNAGTSTNSKMNYEFIY